METLRRLSHGGVWGRGREYVISRLQRLTPEKREEFLIRGEWQGVKIYPLSRISPDQRHLLIGKIGVLSREAILDPRFRIFKEAEVFIIDRVSDGYGKVGCAVIRSPCPIVIPGNLVYVVNYPFEPV